MDQPSNIRKLTSLFSVKEINIREQILRRKETIRTKIQERFPDVLGEGAVDELTRHEYNSWARSILQVADGITTVILHFTGIKNLSEGYKKTVASFVGADNFLDELKGKIEQWFLYLTTTDTPLPKPFLPGPFYRAFRALVKHLDHKLRWGKRLALAQTLLSVPKCADRSSILEVDSAVRKLESIFCEQTNRVTSSEASLFRWIKQLTKELFPRQMKNPGMTEMTHITQKSSYEFTRSVGSFRGLIHKYYGDFIPTIEEFIGFSGGRSPQPIYVPTIGPPTLFADFYDELLAEDCDNKVSMSPVLNRGKIRVVTKGSADLQFLMTPLQERLFSAIHQHPSFTYTSKPVESDLSPLLLFSKDAIKLSGDYADATNRFNPAWSKYTMEQVLERWDLPLELEQAVMKYVGPVTLSRGDRNLTARGGQCMGNLFSFPILCIVNAAIYCMTIYGNRIPRNFKLSNNRVQINGDDIVFEIKNGSLYHRWCRIVSNLGLAVSKNKTGVSRDYFSLNSRIFYYDIHGRVRKAESLMVPLVNNCLNSPVSVSVEKSPEYRYGKPELTRPYWGFANQAAVVLSGLPNRSYHRLADRFLKRRGIDYRSGPLNPWITIKNGGLGLPLPRGFRLEGHEGVLHIDGYSHTRLQRACSTGFIAKRPSSIEYFDRREMFEQEEEGVNFYLRHKYSKENRNIARRLYKRLGTETNERDVTKVYSRIEQIAQVIKDHPYIKLNKVTYDLLYDEEDVSCKDLDFVDRRNLSYEPLIVRQTLALFSREFTDVCIQ